MRRHTEKPFKRNSTTYSLQQQVMALVTAHAQAEGISDSRWLDDLLCRHFKNEIQKPDPK